MSKVRRIYVEKKEPFAVKASRLAHEIRHYLSIDGLKRVRMLTRYDCEGVSDEVYKKALNTVFCEPPVDYVYEESFRYDGRSFSVAYLPGQYDQRADSAMQCLALLDEKSAPIIKTATTYVIEGDITDEQFEAVKNYCINPVDSSCVSEDKPDTLEENYSRPCDVEVLDGFCEMEDAAFKRLYDSLMLAMTYADLLHIQNYFKNDEKRDPTITEIRVLDTYWSDHCRHTTFATELSDVRFNNGYFRKPIEDSYNSFMHDFKEIYGDREDKYPCLMEMALLAMKKLKKEGKLKDQEETDEINACSIVVPVEVDGREEEWLVNFKNETHNHPTEIEPFGGAATCLGGAIRDPLSGRTYVYQAMRVTGAADPTRPVDCTMQGKLPQKKIVREAASGYSSYGNQIGLATGYVREIYHPDYVAKRMEIGAVMAAAKRSCVKRESSEPGDIIILLGGRTGRDGIGGATGSSKAHDTNSTSECGAEVQKGNPPTERKLQRLFRRPEVSRLIKKCNDFGAGGVSVAIGELADGLEVDLDLVPKKYMGLDGTELAISESQERMAVVVAPEDACAFLDYSREENLEATKVAVVTDEPRLVLKWRGSDIVNIKRAFLDTNGAHQEASVEVEIPSEENDYFKNPLGSLYPGRGSGYDRTQDVSEVMREVLSDLNVASQKGLVEMFDGSIGAASVMMPYGGRYQLTPTQSMVAKLPVGNRKCNTATIMSYGFDPYLSSWSPYHGAIYAVVESVSRIVAAGGDYRKIRFSFQEYFRRMSLDPKRWSQPFAALLGAYEAQRRFGLPSIGGKDSMSGTFNDIDVPPTLVSFAVDVLDADHVVSPELKNAGSQLVELVLPKDEYEITDFEATKRIYEFMYKCINEDMITSSYVLDGYGLFAAAARMAFGNRLGVTFNTDTVSREALFAPEIGSIVVEISPDCHDRFYDAIAKFKLKDHIMEVGDVREDPVFIYGRTEYRYEDALHDWTSTLEDIFPSVADNGTDEIHIEPYIEKNIYICRNRVARPGVFIPVFPGTNCEYDTALAFERAGADVHTLVFKNQNDSDITESAAAFAKAIDRAQIVMFPGGFSAGDEPEGSAKFFATAFRNERIRNAFLRLLNERDGLSLGICNGFQALIKLGLVPFGDIIDQSADAPTLTYNTLGRHISTVAYTKVMSNKSPWLAAASMDDIYAIAASHGEGRFVADKGVIDTLIKNGQVATCYVDADGNTTMDGHWNINGSYSCIEGITSMDGRVFGKMCHSERIGDNVMKNIIGKKDMKLFESGVNYFK